MSGPNLTGHACTWTETATATGDSTLDHAGEAGKTHYLAGFNAGGNTASASEHFTITVKDGTDSKIVIDCAAHGPSSGGGQSIAVDLSNPLQITMGAKVQMAWSDATSIQVSASMWGFTL